MKDKKKRKEEEEELEEKQHKDAEETEESKGFWSRIWGGIKAFGAVVRDIAASYGKDAIEYVKKKAEPVTTVIREKYNDLAEKAKDLKKNKPESFWGKVGHYGLRAFDRIVDFVTSKNFGRVALFTSALIMFFSTGPIGGGVSCAVVLGVVAAGVAWESYQKYKLTRLQREDKLLGKLVEHEKERGQSVFEMKSKLANTTTLTPDQKKEYYELIKSIEKGKINRYIEPDKHQAPTYKTIGRSLIGVIPEEFAGLGMSIAAANPLSIAISTISIIARARTEYNFNTSYTAQRADFMNGMESAKLSLGLDYKIGQGTDSLRELERFRDAEAKATIKFKDYLCEQMEKGNPLPKDAVGKYTEFFDKELKKIPVVKPETFGSKVKSYFSSMKDVIFKGFSESKTKAMYNPFAEREKDRDNNRAKIVELKSYSKAIDVELSKQTGIAQQQEKPPLKKATSHVERVSTQLTTGGHTIN